MVGTEVNIYQILNGDCEHLDAFLQNWPEERHAFAEQVYDALINDSNLHPEMVELFLSFKASFIQLASANDGIFCLAENPVRKFLSEAIGRARCWYPVSGRSGRELPEKIRNVFELIASDPESPQGTFTEFLAKEEKRSVLSEQRLCEAELGAVKQISAQADVLNLLNSQLTGCLLSAGIASFLQGPWRSEMQFWHLNGEQYSNEWNLWSRAIAILGDIFNPSREWESKELTPQVQAIFSLLEKSIQLNVCKQDQYEAFVAELNTALFSRLKNRFDSDQPLAPIPSLTSSAHEGASLSRALVAKARSLKVGDWFLFTDEDNCVLRCRLALKLEAAGQLLFVNAHGRKVMLKSVETFLLCLSTLVAKPLPLGPQFELSLTRLINQRRESLALSKRVEVERVEAVALPSDTSEAQSSEEFKADLPHLPDSPIEEEGQNKVSAELGPETLANAEAAMSSLRVGAWVEIKGAGSVENVRCKLAVIIRGTEKYIFTDRLGTKVVEFHRDTLFTKFCHEQVVVHGQGENFEDQLARVIRGLRKT